MRSVGFKDTNRQIDQAVKSKIGVKEGYDQEQDEIAKQKTEYDKIMIASVDNETKGKAAEHAKWQRYYTHMKRMLKTDPVLKILRPKLIGPLDKPILAHLQGPTNSTRLT